MHGVSYSQLALRPPFRVTAPIADEWRLYVVRGDGIMLEADGIGSGFGVLQRGTVVGISGKLRHAFASSSPDTAVLPDADWVERPLGEPAHDALTMIAVSRIPQSSKPFVPLLGSFLRVDPDEYPEITARIGALIDLTAEETVNRDLGSAEVIVRLAEIITIQLRRVGRKRGLFFGDWSKAAECDPKIWSAMSAMSSEPHRAWTVESMAEVAGMSRSAFAARYRQTVGQTPMRSLRRLRMQTAAAALTSSSSQRIAPLAGASGYGSDEAFNRAFVREFGSPPRRYGQRRSEMDEGLPQT